MRFRIIVLMLAIHGLAVGQKKAAPATPLFSIKGSPVYTEEFIYLYKKNNNKYNLKIDQDENDI